MKFLKQLGFLAFLLVAPGLADTLTLKNGDSVEGTYIGGTARVLRMEVNGEVQTFDIGMVTSLRFAAVNGSASAAPIDPPPAPRPSVRPARPSVAYPDSYPDSYPSSSNRPVLRRAPGSDGDAGSSSSSNTPPPPPANGDPDRPILRRAPQSSSDAPPASDSSNSAYTPPPAPMPAPPAQRDAVELPAGTRLTVRMIDSVDSQVARVGDTFRATVDEAVSYNGSTVIPKGADVVAKLVEDDKAGPLTGRTELKLVLTAVRVNDRSYDITTSDVAKESSSKGARTAAAAGGGAILGAIIGAAVGGGKGAAIGAGSGAAVGTGASAISKGPRVKVPTETRLDFTLSYPVRI